MLWHNNHFLFGTYIVKPGVVIAVSPPWSQKVGRLKGAEPERNADQITPQTSSPFRLSVIWRDKSPYLFKEFELCFLLLTALKVPTDAEVGEWWFSEDWIWEGLKRMEVQLSEKLHHFIKKYSGIICTSSNSTIITTNEWRD